MTTQIVQHMHDDLEVIKRDLAVIKHILSEEGRLTAHARTLLDEARATPEDEYVSQEELEKRVGLCRTK